MSRIVTSLLSGLVMTISGSTVVLADDLAPQVTREGMSEFSIAPGVTPKLKAQDGLIGRSALNQSGGDHSRLGAPPPRQTESIMNMVPKVGPFAVTF